MGRQMSPREAIANKKTFEKVDFFMIGTLPATNFEIGPDEATPRLLLYYQPQLGLKVAEV
jgi:hypothetical protein